MPPLNKDALLQTVYSHVQNKKNMLVLLWTDFFFYFTGYGYMLPPTVIPKILSKLNETKLIAMEDVFFTGSHFFRILSKFMLHYLYSQFGFKSKIYVRNTTLAVWSCE